MKSYQKSFIFLMLVTSSAFLFGYDKVFLNKVYNETLKSYDLIEPEKEVKNIALPKTLSEIMSHLFSSFTFQFTELSVPLQLKRFFESCPLEYFATTQECVDFNTVIDLELLRGKHNPADHYISRITSYVDQNDEKRDFLLTIVGQKFFTEAIAMPISNVQVLKNRQRVIQYLSENYELLKEIYTHLHVIKENEQYFFDFADKTEVPMSVKGLLNPFFGLKTGGIEKWLARFMKIAMPASALYSGVMATKNPDAYHRKDKDGTIIVNGKEVALGHWGNFCVQVLFLPVTVAGEKQYAHAFKQLHTHLIKVAQMMRSVKFLVEVVAEHPFLQGCISHGIRERVRLNGQNSGVHSSFVALNALLDESTFDDGDATIFSSIGNILKAYGYLCDPEVRKEYTSTLGLIGELDVYAALALKKIAHQDKENAQICCVDFIEKSDKPILEMVDFWNPFVKTADVVANTLSLNTGKERCMLITGPNTGGKSTNMKAIVMNAILAQSFGVAAAKSCRMTPFEMITTYLNIGDDTAGGKSLFKAEVERAQNLLQSLRDLKPGQFGFAMLDEIFTGTSPDKAEQLAFDLMRTISKFENVIFVNATHFKPLTRLEQETKGVVKNYQVEALLGQDGRVSEYTYKLVPGISAISSAMQVAEESGISFK